MALHRLGSSLLQNTNTIVCQDDIDEITEMKPEELATSIEELASSLRVFQLSALDIAEQAILRVCAFNAWSAVGERDRELANQTLGTRDAIHTAHLQLLEFRLRETQMLRMLNGHLTTIMKLFTLLAEGDVVDGAMYDFLATIFTMAWVVITGAVELKNALEDGVENEQELSFIDAVVHDIHNLRSGDLNPQANSKIDWIALEKIYLELLDYVSKWLNNVGNGLILARRQYTLSELISIIGEDLPCLSDMEGVVSILAQLPTNITTSKSRGNTPVMTNLHPEQHTSITSATAFPIFPSWNVPISSPKRSYTESSCGGDLAPDLSPTFDRDSQIWSPNYSPASRSTPISWIEHSTQAQCSTPEPIPCLDPLELQPSNPEANSEVCDPVASSDKDVQNTPSPSSQIPLVITASAYRPPPQKGKNRIQCKYCELVFDRPSAHEIHMRTHTGEKPFVCNNCGTAFASKSNVKRHKESNRCRHTFMGSGRPGHSSSMTQPPSPVLSSLDPGSSNQANPSAPD
ncbi:hypothetical protein FRC03_005760 [Tulasnella sp. 419]|nr:hypothetical protein FRC03_005760 [Tulasnella sp. 419]